ncbi:LPS export ABC transporter periplasmic protein LptC [Thalassomonas sp. M1454]|uniref:LPS export ABC transporter periplasmic protein LptC n=1 Tax=Thalassomonas sp. M1454 TaxID=2594477 RepID=UPI00117DE558|nr:LPS export ABC transporter periplasmic protein LptC [Thalassomonas sp. M1454]TRX52780.1 LPS export ABC transporter periplasmic protein LptC [Thalassomonas sp. M1454]
MSRLHTLSTIVFAIALAIYGYLQWQQSNQAVVAKVEDENTPDFVATKLSSNQFNSDGELTHTIFAQSMSHFSNKNQTIFQKPKYTIYPDDNKPSWHISANQGILQGSEQLTLSEQVLLVSSDKNSFISQIEGKEIMLDLVNKIITSEQTILLKGNDFTMYGSGLNVDINTTEMTLNEHVQTIFKKHDS